MLTRQTNQVDLPLPLVIVVAVIVALLVLRMVGREKV